MTKSNYENLDFKPVFKPEIPPTNRDKLNKNKINTSSSAPQFSVKVWKSSGWREFAYYFPITISIFLFLIGVLVLGEKRDAEYAPYFFVGGVLFLFLIIPFRLWGKCIYTLGFDWAKNTIWVKKSHRGVTAVEVDANTIEYFNFMDNTIRSHNPNWYSNRSQSRYRVKKQQVLVIKRNSSPHVFQISGSELATRSEAKKVYRLANNLLNSQK